MTFPTFVFVGTLALDSVFELSISNCRFRVFEIDNAQHHLWRNSDVGPSDFRSLRIAARFDRNSGHNAEPDPAWS